MIVHTANHMSPSRQDNKYLFWVIEADPTSKNVYAHLTNKSKLSYEVFCNNFLISCATCLVITIININNWNRKPVPFQCLVRWFIMGSYLSFESRIVRAPWKLACFLIELSHTHAHMHVITSLSTHWVTMKPYGDTKLGQHWFRRWLVSESTKEIRESSLTYHNWVSMKLIRWQYHTRYTSHQSMN